MPQTIPPHTCKVMVWRNCLGHIETCTNIFLSILCHFHSFFAMSSYLYDTNFSDPLPPLSLHCKDREFTGTFDAFPKMVVSRKLSRRHVSDGCKSFGIVSVCVCVSFSAELTNIDLNFGI